MVTAGLERDACGTWFVAGCSCEGYLSGLGDKHPFVEGNIKGSGKRTVTEQKKNQFTTISSLAKHHAVIHFQDNDHI